MITTKNTLIIDININESVQFLIKDDIYQETLATCLKQQSQYLNNGK